MLNAFKIDLSLHSTEQWLTLTTRSPPASTKPTPPTPHPLITCGPRQPGPTVRGRTLSTEAILAVQSGMIEGAARLLKAMVGAGREGRRRRFMGLMKRGGCVPNEYLFGFLVRGLRRLGDEEGAKMVERDYEEWDVNGKWGEVEEGEEEIGVVGV
ncbi:uncharacterized protein LOC109841540 [Asparagus officinalis]|uniref:uncharacterized protein LOC109841540 n=1 Tax=Asparagus officinalis TaxID=4686 RepID=UPI00098E7DB8|nr:uncharacterized protein LOC109841540 [Asparagus officinalis]